MDLDIDFVLAVEKSKKICKLKVLRDYNIQKQRQIQKSVLIVTSTSFYSNFIFGKFVNKPIFFINSSAIFALFVFQFFRLSFTVQCTITRNTFQQFVNFLNCLFILSLPINIMFNPVSVKVISLILPPLPQALPLSLQRPFPDEAAHHFCRASQDKTHCFSPFQAP